MGDQDVVAALVEMVNVDYLDHLGIRENKA